MRLVVHPMVYSDIDEIMGYYERPAADQRLWQLSICTRKN
jgi:hypothetical protein